MAERMPRRAARKNVPSKQPVKRRAGRRTFVLDEDLKKMIREEARRLNLSEEEYLRLVLHFSEVVRTSILPAGLLDGGLLKMLISNPLVLEMLKNMASNMVSQFGQKKQAQPSTGATGQARGPMHGGQQTPWGGVQGPHAGMPFGGAAPSPMQPRGGQAPMQGGMYGQMPYGNPGMGQPAGFFGEGTGFPQMGAMPGPMNRQPSMPSAQPMEQQAESNDFSLEGLSRMVMQFLGSK